jgi:outer membrane protein OmpA-like peptidoglycan-associated protein
MSEFFKNFKLFLSTLAALYLISCAHTAPIPQRTMEFEEGIKALASNLGEQLEKSSIRNVLNKVVINPVTNRKQLKKIVIDPFIDVESGYPVKANTRIFAIMSEEIKKRFEITGAMEPDNLEVSEYVLNGMVTVEREQTGQGHRYKVYGAVFEKSSGKVLASASVLVNRFDTTPMDIYKDSPVFLKGENYQRHASSVKKSPDETVEKGYHDRLMIKSMQVKGDMLYEQKEYKKSLSYYDQAASSQSGQQLEVLNGQFTNLLKQGEWDRAETVYAKLIRASIAETGELASKITFNPNSLAPIESKARIYGIYIKQIAKLVAAVPSCRIQIIGHSSRTGKEAYNDNLSLQRSLWIQKQMASYVSEMINRSETIGRGFRENIVGTGTDDITDEIDRRVEFKFSNCVE